MNERAHLAMPRMGLNPFQGKIASLFSGAAYENL